MPNLPDKPSDANSPARRVSSAELEAVIRRATELQFARGDVEEGLSEAEVMRIGKELGLEPAHVRRAMSEVRGRVREEKGMMVSVMGPDTVRAGRTIRRPAAALGMTLEEYLVSCEFMVVARRFPDRTRYLRGNGMGAALGRAAAKMGQRSPMLDLRQVDVHVSPVDEDTAYVELSVPLGSVRTGLTVGGVVGGGGAGAAAGISTAIMFADPFALIGFPILGAAVLGARLIYRGVAGGVQERLEAFLDRVEHGELPNPAKKRPEWRRQLGI
ncbi:MAG: hypothetical protein AVDCRST_MAG68-2275 [uncultured Gemmatimonadetes bacterium]|uniref:Uncharacterized protein n=1 Tax=uncultured Gemmatimonadota bacterium TaxID=203437 RepID=A0A6J4LBL0_9BACT|nr:MAG: hypothetical protein AVDCRST_MAG68-2275 [uncultured Gemmatimonadota bacterium]